MTGGDDSDATELTRDWRLHPCDQLAVVSVSLRLHFSPFPPHKDRVENADEHSHTDPYENAPIRPAVDAHELLVPSALSGWELHVEPGMEHTPDERADTPASRREADGTPENAWEMWFLRHEIPTCPQNFQSENRTGKRLNPHPDSRNLEPPREHELREPMRSPAGCRECPVSKQSSCPRGTCKVAYAFTPYSLPI